MSQRRHRNRGATAASLHRDGAEQQRAAVL